MVFPGASFVSKYKEPERISVHFLFTEYEHGMMS